MPTQVMLGQLPLFVAPRIDKGLVIGYATGVTVGSMLQSPIQSVTCVELEPARSMRSRFFRARNNRPLEDPRTRLIIDDARTLPARDAERYDIIVSEPSHPWCRGGELCLRRSFSNWAGAVERAGNLCAVGADLSTVDGELAFSAGDVPDGVSARADVSCRWVE
jgi:spermidine synthase